MRKHELREIFSRTYRNAEQRGLEFYITFEEFTKLYEDTGGACSLTGIPFNDNIPSGMSQQRRPWAASLDRIDSGVGYTVKNCRFVCSCVNTALNVYGDDVFLTMAVAAANKNEALSLGVNLAIQSIVESAVKNTINSLLPKIIESAFNKHRLDKNFSNKPVLDFTVPPTILNRSEVCERVGLSNTSIWRLEQANKFPSRIRISPGRIGWLSTEVDEYISSVENGLFK